MAKSQTRNRQPNLVKHLQHLQLGYSKNFRDGWGRRPVWWPFTVVQSDCHIPFSSGGSIRMTTAEVRTWFRQRIQFCERVAAKTFKFLLTVDVDLKFNFLTKLFTNKMLFGVDRESTPNPNLIWTKDSSSWKGCCKTFRFLLTVDVFCLKEVDLKFNFLTKLFTNKMLFGVDKNRMTEADLKVCRFLQYSSEDYVERDYE